MTRSWPAILVGMALLHLVACDTLPPAKQAQTVSIMTFNVENLFDNRHDAGKDDYTYLPSALKDNPEHQTRCAKIKVRAWREQCANWDWSDAALDEKMKRLSAAILGNENGVGPDILVLQEVENRAVLEALRSGYLRAAGYGPTIHIEGSDERGIDVAFMSRLPVVGEARLHPMEFESIDPVREKDTRGILEATFRLPDGRELTGFAVHFPAPFHPIDLRVQSYQFLNRLQASLPAGRAAFAAGDFNTPSAEARIIDEHAAGEWLVAHRLGCDGCRGTYYYAPNDDWSFLDMILLTPNLTPGAAGWSLRPAATRVANAEPRQTTAAGRPARFDVDGPSGVSDHWPLRLELSTPR